MDLQLQTAENRYIRIVFVSSIIIICFYLATLARVLKGTRHLFLVVLIVMLILSNLCSILSDTFANVWIYDSSKKIPYLYLEAVATFVRDSTFNLAHWVFCFKYWIIAIEMEYLLDQKELSKNFVLLLHLINYVFIALDIIMPVIYSVTFAVLNLKYENQTTKQTVEPS